MTETVKMPQLQTSAPPRHQEDEETDKTKQAQIEKARKAPRLALFSPSEVIAMLKGQQKHRLGTVCKYMQKHRLGTVCKYITWGGVGVKSILRGHKPRP